MNVVMPVPLLILIPLFVTPVEYALPVPVVRAVFIQNGCPEAEMSNTYLAPLVNTMVGLF